MADHETFQIFEDHLQWKTVKEVCARLKGSGFQALLAGGSVRDLIMKRIPNDFDVATDATPDQVEALFDRAVTVGKAFGVTILPFNLDGEAFQIEVATFREDLEYRDGRRPEGVKFSDAKADAGRRDFTVNALFLDPVTNQVIDYVGGEKDIAARVLRTVGDPARRFDEDKLRILRAIRFAAQLDFEIAPETMKSVTELAPEVSVVSRERIRDELLKLLKSPRRVRGLELLLSTGVLESAFPATAEAILKDEKSWLDRFRFAPDVVDPIFWLALFVWPAFDANQEASFRDQHLKSLRLENQAVDQIVFVLKNLDRVLNPSKVRFGELVQLSAHPQYLTLLKLAEVAIANGSHSSEKQRMDLLAKAQVAGRSGDSLVKAWLDGRALKDLGIASGPKMGHILNEAYLLQLEGKLTSKQAALDWAKAQ